MEAPKLADGKCSVLIAELSTGHIFKRDMTFFLVGQNEKEVFQEFENIDDATKFALELINTSPRFECCIFDDKGNFLSKFDKYQERSI